MRRSGVRFPSWSPLEVTLEDVVASHNGKPICYLGLGLMEVIQFLKGPCYEIQSLTSVPCATWVIRLILQYEFLENNF
jgi:hypothetical protein